MMGIPGPAVSNPPPVPGNIRRTFGPVALRAATQSKDAIINIADRFLIADHLANLVAPNGQYALT
jgi:hypothetical protein